MNAMSEYSVSPSTPEIVVGIKLEKDASWLVKTASAVAVACHVRLKLVHVIEAEGVTKDGGRMVDIAHEHMDKDIGIVLEDLERLKSLCAEETRPEIVVLRGKDPAVLLSSPELFPSGIMLIVGSETHLYRFVPHGISLVMNLLSRAKLPILIVHEDVPLERWTKNGINIVIADDLTPSFQLVLERAVAIIRCFSKPHIFHIHIAETNVSGAVSPFTPIEDPRPWSNEESLRRWDSQCELMQKELESRWTSALAHTVRNDPSGSYQAEVITDQPMHGLLKSDDRFKADLIVVGPLREPTKERKVYTRISNRKLLDKSEALLVVSV